MIQGILIALVLVYLIYCFGKPKSTMTITINDPRNWYSLIDGVSLHEDQSLGENT